MIEPKDIFEDENLNPLIIALNHRVLELEDDKNAFCQYIDKYDELHREQRESHKKLVKYMLLMGLGLMMIGMTGLSLAVIV
tara:strand:- start:681 stop:923 length:243 start_codon:yes stop_codon:yes gene_type:complete